MNHELLVGIEGYKRAGELTDNQITDMVNNRGYHEHRLGLMALQQHIDRGLLGRTHPLNPFVNLLVSQLQAQVKVMEDYMDWIRTEFPTQNQDEFFRSQK